MRRLPLGSPNGLPSPPRQVDPSRELGDLADLAFGRPVRGEGRHPPDAAGADDGGGDRFGKRMPHDEADAARPAVLQEGMGAPGGIRPGDDLLLRRGSTGNWARAASSTVTWSAAVPEPALPGRKIPAKGSPVASRNASKG